MEAHLKSALKITERFLSEVKEEDKIKTYIANTCFLAKAEQDSEFIDSLMVILKKYILEPFPIDTK